VRVRLLLDDNNTTGLDPTLATLDAHPNIEVRLFNPFGRRRARVLDYLFEFGRLNRRMHNKSFTVDGQATIVGGRNVGDEYFGAGQEMSFQDLDVLGIGSVVGDVRADFDAYWGAEASVRFANVAPIEPRTNNNLLETADELQATDRASQYRQALRETPLVQNILQGALPFEWTDASLVSDPPSKVLAQGSIEPTIVLDRLKIVLDSATERVDIISPYFVPTKAGVAALRAMTERGVRVRVLTNSLAATDVPAVHAGYARYRRALLEAGIELYELKRTQEGRPNPGKRGARGGSSGASLHAKAFAVDRHSAYVGSFNFDPRSARLNTEMGVLLESPALASRVSDVLDRDLGTTSYQVRLGKNGHMHWLTTNQHGHEQHFDSEPETSVLRRFAVRLLSLLPIEGLL
jgi:putative cardiolipin synthase